MKPYVLIFVLIVRAFGASNRQPDTNSIGKKAEQQFRLVGDDSGSLNLVDIAQPYQVEEAESSGETLFVAETDVVFTLFTRRSPDQGHVIVLNDSDSLIRSGFLSSHPTRVLIHGWKGGSQSALNKLLRREYLIHGGFNIIVVDWSVGADTQNYVAARNRVNEVGPLVSRFIDFLSNGTNASFSDLTIIGHSLGAHVAGIAGKHTVNVRVKTIIALDPAGPLFSLGSPENRIAENDAEYVEVIYTNSGVNGFDLPLGQSNFYPNGGRKQPGCGSDLEGSCAHGRGVEYFAESINTCVKFVATRCADYNEIQAGQCTPSGPAMEMGGEPSNGNRNHTNGIYYLKTNSEFPFARG